MLKNICSWYFILDIFKHQALGEVKLSFSDHNVRIVSRSGFFSQLYWLQWHVLRRCAKYLYLFCQEYQILATNFELDLLTCIMTELRRLYWAFVSKTICYCYEKIEPRSQCKILSLAQNPKVKSKYYWLQFNFLWVAQYGNIP